MQPSSGISLAGRIEANPGALEPESRQREGIWMGEKREDQEGRRLEWKKEPTACWILRNNI
jgi:hypothetical protein